jgi:long-subunit fatty acid transport protein
LVSLNFGYSFNKTNNLNSTVRIQGINNTSSMADYWADISEGTNYNDLSGAAGLAYDAWIIDTITGTNATSYGTVFNNYGDNIGSLYGQNVRRIITNQGYTGEHAFSIGGNISNKIFFGATLGINRLKYTGHYEHLEKADYVMDSGLKDFTYTEHFENTGTGVSFKIGAIIKPIESVRIGLAFHSPTRYKIDEYFYDNVSSNFDGNDSYEFQNDPNRYNYALTTPFRAIAGVAVQVKKVAILSADYEYIDYSTAKFSETGDNYDYSEKNLEIQNTLQRTGNLRLGGEFRLNKMYFRGGYGYYGKVFKPGELNEDMHHTSISCGLGFREQNFNVDLGYVNMSNSQDYILYNTFSENVSSTLNTTKNIFMVTLGYKFGY